MIIFQTIRKNMAAMGFTPNQQQNSHRKFSFRQTVCTVKYSIDILLIGVYVFCEADRTDEYMESIFAFTAGIAITIAFISIIWKNDQLFNLLELSSQELTISIT